MLIIDNTEFWLLCDYEILCSGSQNWDVGLGVRMIDGRCIGRSFVDVDDEARPWWPVDKALVAW